MCWTPLYASKHKKTFIRHSPSHKQLEAKKNRNIVVIRKVPQTSQHRTQNVKTHNRTTQKTKKMSNTDPTKKTVLLIYTVKSGKSLGSDRGKKTLHKK
jgi:hypothetical protein